MILFYLGGRSVTVLALYPKYINFIYVHCSSVVLSLHFFVAVHLKKKFYVNMFTPNSIISLYFCIICKCSVYSGAFTKNDTPVMYSFIVNSVSFLCIGFFKHCCQIFLLLTHICHCCRLFELRVLKCFLPKGQGHKYRHT